MNVKSRFKNFASAAQDTTWYIWSYKKHKLVKHDLCVQEKQLIETRKDCLQSFSSEDALSKSLCCQSFWSWFCGDLWKSWAYGLNEKLMCNHEYDRDPTPVPLRRAIFICSQKIRTFISSCLLFLYFCDPPRNLCAKSVCSYRWPCRVPVFSLGIVPVYLWGVGGGAGRKIHQEYIK